jgi:hypothetical protein
LFKQTREAMKAHRFWPLLGRKRFSRAISPSAIWLAAGLALTLSAAEDDEFKARLERLRQENSGEYRKVQELMKVNPEAAAQFLREHFPRTPENAKRLAQPSDSKTNNVAPAKKKAEATLLPPRTERFTKIETLAVGEFSVDLCRREDGAFGLGARGKGADGDRGVAAAAGASAQTAVPVGAIPPWFPHAPPLPPPQGELIRVSTADELLAAVDGVGTGGTILVADGNFKLPRVIVLERKKDLTIRSAAGNPANVTLSGKGWASNAKGDDIIHIGHCDGVTIADLTFAECHFYGIKVEAEHAPKNIHIYNCRFRDIGVRAIKGSAGQDPNIRAVKGSVRYCSFENTKVPPTDWLFGGDYISAIDMMALEDWTFSDNVFRNIKGRNGGGRAAIFIWVRSRRVVVERNLIIDCDRGVAFGNPGQSTANRAGERLAYVSDAVIRNNFIVGGPDCGIELWHAERIRIFHNSISRPERNWSRGIRIGTGTSQADIVNNLVHGEIRLEGGEAQLRQNLARRLDGYFVDLASGNLALTPAAIGAIDQGVSLPEVTDDIRGRPRLGLPDLGAWESDRERKTDE